MQPSHHKGQEEAASAVSAGTSGVSDAGPIPHAEAWASILSTAARSFAGIVRYAERAEELRYTGRLFREIELERARVARELHAGAGQPLAGIRFNTELLESWAEKMDQPQREALERVRVLSEQALDQVRSLSHRMHPSVWQRLGLTRALHELVDSSGARNRFKTETAIEEICPEPGRNAKAAIYRCAQECIANAIRHSTGTSLSISLRNADGWLELRISDNGPRSADEDAGEDGLGLRAMEEHAALAGGDCRIRASQLGTVIVMRVPSGK
jgi:signal transduction histidine kinase